MPYTVDQLIEDFRSDVYDNGAVDDAGTRIDTLWSDADVIRYANFAAAQWAKDTLFVRRNMSLTTVANKSNYYTGQDIIEIVRANLAPATGGRGRDLTIFNLDEGVLRDDYGVAYVGTSDLETAVGTPRGITLDYDPSYIRLYPMPQTGGDVLRLNMVVYPAELRSGMPMPSENFRDRHLILLWMKNLAYRKQDADVLDLDRADGFRNEYFSMVYERAAEIDRVRRKDPVMASRW